MENFEKKANTVGTQEAGKMLGLQAATVAQKCRNNEFPNAKQYKKGTPWLSVDREDYKEKYYKHRK